MKFVKVAKFSPNYQKLKQRLSSEDLANAYILKNLTTKATERVYYLNHIKKDKDKATLIIYGLKQYHHEATSQNLITELLDLVGNISSLDLCFDSYKPYNIEAIKEYFEIYQPTKYQGNTIYINTPNLANILKICIYNKTIKNNSDFECYRAEATINIPHLNAKNEQLNRKQRLELTFTKSLNDYGLFLNLATKEPAINCSDAYYKRQATLKDKI
ncbi:hypothetical protein [Campylobacter hyointestinalis]|uniref:hypothetical protein n=1 Tax=Campylobacter hyointestinalis TaxID=198 RepID=UPI002556D9C7|nr:hypothetical protein [Campylobacter hyointestinalis]MDL2346177.1 hypothetical protein [Campylobacter hyointestinalis]MDL2347917.1 hypothetical protein [Campylobacter hyointestinalis]MDL2349660.1 hypothetical protein [Campylobacter hyointestinalis]MDM1025665.1 hypothetical protein [Campylobacter hyointestinalis]MDM1027666.1 hypothetical protein [Campylobacter hyointestinalis]